MAIKKRLFLLCALTLALAALCGCADGGQITRLGDKYTTELYAMDTHMSLAAYGDNASEALLQGRAMIERFDALFDAQDSGSDVYAINQNAGRSLAVDASTYALLGEALGYSALTGGAFDITVYPAVQAWGFISAQYTVPSEEELEILKGLTGYERVSLDGGEAAVQRGMSIDLGGVAKGYAARRLAELFASLGVESAIISLGGNVQCVGSKPDGSPWRVDIQDPADAGGVLGTLRESDRAIVTSGSYQRYFEHNGKIYHHIIDPQTCAPAQSGLLSVTVVCRDGALADALSTALFVMGLEKGRAFLAENADISAVFVTTAGEVFYSPGLDFTPAQYSAYTFRALE